MLVPRLAVIMTGVIAIGLVICRGGCGLLPDFAFVMRHIRPINGDGGVLDIEAFGKLRLDGLYKMARISTVLWLDMQRGKRLA